MLFQLDGSHSLKNWVIFHADRIFYMMCIYKLSPYPKQVGSFIFMNVWLHYTVLTLPIYQRICRIYDRIFRNQTDKQADDLLWYIAIILKFRSYTIYVSWIRRLGVWVPLRSRHFCLKIFDTFTRTLFVCRKWMLLHDWGVLVHAMAHI